MMPRLNFAASAAATASSSVNTTAARYTGAGCRTAAIAGYRRIAAARASSSSFAATAPPGSVSHLCLPSSRYRRFSASSFPGEEDDNPSWASAPSSASPRPKKAARRRTRSSPTSDMLRGVPSLEDFMHRSKALNQYRSFVRLARFVDSGGASGGGGGGESGTTATGECRAALEEVRTSFRDNLDRRDKLSKTMALAEGERRLRELQSTVGYDSQRKDDKSENYDEDSWLNTKDEEDPRGRVGTDWPWSR